MALDRTRVLAVAGLAALAAACVSATPEAQVRLEQAGDAVVGPLCDRMREDFEMRPAPNEDGTGTLYRANFTNRLFSARGVYFVVGGQDVHGGSPCQTEPKGLKCIYEGPGTVRVQSAAGRAQYVLRQGEEVVVTTQGAVLTCEQLATA